MKRILSIIALAALVLSAGAQTKATQTKEGQTKRMAVCALSENMMRAKPDYESALETQSLMGTVVEIIAEEGYWRQVVTPEPYTAWCTNLGLVEMTAEQINEYKAAHKYICTAYHSGVHSSPSLKAERLSDLSMGNLVRVVYMEGKKVGPSVIKKGKTKWAEVMLPDGRKGWTPLTDLEDFGKWAQKPKPSEGKIIATAKMFIGTPYLWGGASSKGLDCSGLVRLSWFMNGYLLPRNASQQVHLGREIIVEANHSINKESEKFYDEMCKRIENLKPGDLVFFGNPETRWKKESITHVGIYIGNGEIIHASHKVRINSLIPGKSNYYENAHRLLKARRLFDWKGEGFTPISQSKAYNL